MEKIIMTNDNDKQFSPLTVEKNDRLYISMTDAGFFRFHFCSVQDGNAYYPSYNAHGFIQRFPEASRINAKETGYHYRVPVTEISIQLIDEVWPKSNLRMDAEANIHYATKKNEMLRLKENAVINAAWEMDRKIPTDTNVDSHPEYRLADYQKVAAHLAMENDGFALFMEQGTGKTACAIAAMCSLARRSDKPISVLIVCPNNVRMNWQREIEKFATVSGKVQIVRGQKQDRIVKYVTSTTSVLKEGQKFNATILGYGSLTGDIENIAIVANNLIKDKYDFAILDESHYIKTPSAKRTKAAQVLSKISKKRLVLTGTPITNTCMDLYSQLEYCKEGLSGFSSFNAFQSFYGVYETVSDKGFKKLIGVQNLPFMKKRLAGCSFAVKKTDVLKDLPEKTFDIIECELSKEQQKVYDTVLRELVLELDSEIGNVGQAGDQLVINNVLVKMLRLAQVTSGHLTFSPVYNPETGEVIKPGRTDRFDPNPKLEELIEVLKSKGPDEKTIVWACFTQDIKTIMARLELEGIKAVRYDGKMNHEQREKSVDAFNNDYETKVFVGNAAAGGAGLNLLGYNYRDPESEWHTSNADHCIYFSKNWSYDKWAQSQDRLHRRGTRVPVRISSMIVPGSIDEEIDNRIRMKLDHANDVQSLRSILSRIKLTV